jgi:hypothetical protein
MTKRRRRMKLKVKLSVSSRRMHPESWHKPNRSHHLLYLVITSVRVRAITEVLLALIRFFLLDYEVQLQKL